MLILYCSLLCFVDFRVIDSQALKAQLLPSRPEEFHLQPLTDSVRVPLDSYGSCRPSLQNLSTLELRNKPKLLSFPIDLGSPQADTSPSLHPHYRDFNTTMG